MTIVQRIRDIIVGLVMLALALFLLIAEDNAYPAIVAIYATVLEIAGFRLLWYYLTMARHMVGGLRILYQGAIYVDIGLFTASLINVPQMYILIYLTGTLAFSAVVDLLRARESKSIQSSWKLKAFQGAVELLIALICLIYMHTPVMVVDVFCAGYIFSAFMKIVGAFRRAPVITIS